MGRGSWRVAGSVAVAVVALALAATALAKPVTAKTGVFAGTVVSPGLPVGVPAEFKVSKAGGSRLAVELTIDSLHLTCNSSVGSLPVDTTGISTKQLKQNGKGAPLAIKNGKFSYKGPIYGGPSTSPGSAEISGSFKSPTKVVATASFSWESVTLVPGQTAPCETGKLSFSAKHP